MNKKLITYAVWGLLAVILAYNSITIKKLDAKTEASAHLDPVAYARKFWSGKFTQSMDSAINLVLLKQALKENTQAAFAKYSKTQGVGNNACFLVKAEGTVDKINEDNIQLSVKSGDAVFLVKLNTGLYFGNGVRDVTGLISMDDFANTMDFNSVSKELNKLALTEVIAPFKAKAVKGSVLQFIACLELSNGQSDIENKELLPVKITRQ